jgi:selenocysteine lyase/cysteine desulfurase
VTEHNAVLRPLRHLARRKGTEIDLIGLTRAGELEEEAFQQALARKPDLVVLNHASNVTGRVLKVGQYFQWAREAGARTLLDASQTIGQIPVCPEPLTADLVAFPGHKYLLGPGGTGALYVSPRVELEQYLVGGTGSRSDLPLHPEEFPERLEAGTPNEPGLAGLAAALDWLEAEGAAVQQKCRTLSRQLRQGLEETPNVGLYGAGAFEENLGIFPIRLKDWDVEETGFVLAESFGIICRAGLHCAPLMARAIGCHPDGTVRLSLSGLNRDEEISRVLAALHAMSRSTGN